MFKVKLVCGWNHQLYKACCLLLLFSGDMYSALSWVLVWRYNGFIYGIINLYQIATNIWWEDFHIMNSLINQNRNLKEKADVFKALLKELSIVSAERISTFEFLTGLLSSEEKLKHPLNWLNLWHGIRFNVNWGNQNFLLPRK